MKIGMEIIEHVAELARLKLTKQEIKKFSEQLKEVLEAFSKLDEVDTKNVKELIQPIDLKNVMRDDKEEKCLSQEEALSQTELKKDGYFKGPRAV